MSKPEPSQSDTSQRIPPGQQLVAPGKWPVIGERSPATSNQPWSLEIKGAVAKPLQFSLQQLGDLPQTEVSLDIHCVTRWSMLDVTIKGVLLAEILKLASPTSSAKFLSFIARSDRLHSSSLSIDTAIEQQTLIALQVNGEPLEPGHGGPIRNIVPGRYFYKSVKWLSTIEVLESDRLGFWEAESGYHNEADPWEEQRYMVPSIDRRLATELIRSKDFSNRDLRSIDASNRELIGLKANGASLRDSKFINSDVSEADFSQANLSNAHFVNANLTNVNFRDSDLEGADFSGADLRGADFTGASLIGASFFSKRDGQMVAATFNKQTTLPDEMIAPLFPEQLAFVKSQLVKTEAQ
jgi:DMSO/TMAO reductase YedYZ molybdopterin-dependent catalytic subunit